MNISKRMKQLMCISKRSRNFCSSNQWNNDINKIRNIGILAHIDAGKTTTTERMLYYSGKIHHMGEVHHGNTVTDYMTQERERGITIKSAAVTFKWKGHQFNLIDTPGHIDFTMEVEETLSVLDSAIVILDASAGVEAQTVTVWRQADRYKIPRLVYINKMDRADANLESCCTSIEKKFGSPTLCLQLPLMENGKFVGLIDILTLEKLVPSKEKLTRTLLIEQEDLRNWTAAKNARSVLVDRLTDLDDNFANLVISADSIDHIQTTEISKTLWKITAKQDATPVLCGSSYKNIGVEPLMDAVILYLTSPKDGNNIYSCFKNSLCARAFKIIHDKQRGPLVFLRIYCGEFKQGQKIYNITKDCTEHSGRLYIAYADEFQEIGSMQNGNIAVVSGLKVTTVGDLISQSAPSAQRAKDEVISSTKDNELVDRIFGTGTKIPEPVFFCSIEPPSLAYEKQLDQALSELQREDPSLKVTHEPETGQTVLAGMGELHLEIIKDRILKEYKINAELGALQIAYCETPTNSVSHEITNEVRVGSTKHLVTVSLSIVPKSVDEEKEVLKLDRSSEAASNLANIHHRTLQAIKQGIKVALTHGPRINCKVINAQVVLHKLEIGRGTSETMVSATVTQCLQKVSDFTTVVWLLYSITDVERSGNNYLGTNYVFRNSKHRRVNFNNFSRFGSKTSEYTECNCQRNWKDYYLRGTLVRTIGIFDRFKNNYLWNGIILNGIFRI
uniref:Tr-type G domain-containing protein n=1 Tax=Photinus pyralis TaxID=7054 RepID=A0A1Y1MZ82_PHOPY